MNDLREVTVVVICAGRERGPPPCSLAWSLPRGGSPPGALHRWTKPVPPPLSGCRAASRTP